MFRLLLHSISNSTLRDMRNIVPSDSNQAFAFQIRSFLSFFLSSTEITPPDLIPTSDCFSSFTEITPPQDSEPVHGLTF
ncbi:hypothetical protein P8452_31368 [Trifolium repens]|nr:hypothetical protein P8452_31368 [Trifolium repens]